MGFIEIKKDIYLTLVVLGLTLLTVAFILAPRAFGPDPAGTLLYFISVIQGSICLGFGAFTWIFHEDPEIWR